MRYPRNVKIFRGGVDAAPFAGLFFATVPFMVLFYSHVFFPGVPVVLGNEDEAVQLTGRTVQVLRDGSVNFLGESFDASGFQAELNRRVQRGELPGRVILERDAGASEETVKRFEDALKEAGVQIKLPGTRMQLPEDTGFAGVSNPVVVVGVNLNGQIFYQHQKIQEATLQARLAEAVEKAGEPLTLLLEADRNLPLEKAMQLSKVARKAGISRVIIGTRPPLL